VRQELLMPKLGLTMTEGTVAEWIVSPGGEFRAGDTLLLIETDKVTSEVPAETDGVLLEVTANVGDVVNVGLVIGYVGASGHFAVAARPALEEPTSESTVVITDVPSSAPPVHAAARLASRADGRIISTPLARRVAALLGVDLKGVSGTGPRGRVKAEDVRAAAAHGSRSTAAATAVVAPAPAQGASAAPKLGTVVKPTSVQATMARRLTQAKQQIPHFYLAAEADVARMLAARAEINASKPAVKLTLNHLVIAAVARAMRDLPVANQVWTEEGIQIFDSVDIGVAVNTDRGLLVPVVRDIGRAPLAEVAAKAGDVVDRARHNALKPGDMGGGAITISNAGMHEVTWMTPIINPGTSMILGVGSIRDVFRPDAEGRPILRLEMGLVLAADHRLVDGVSGLAFLNRVIELLRNPLPLLYG
jgi:pyruvate dehydrogenase E2 component (dihydrolipoamide acetyltransferase)